MVRCADVVIHPDTVRLEPGIELHLGLDIPAEVFAVPAEAVVGGGSIRPDDMFYGGTRIDEPGVVSEAHILAVADGI